MKRCPPFAWLGSLIVMIVLTAGGVRAQDAELAAARDLYASAAYDDALAMLNRLRVADHPVSQSPTIEQYRAFCLLALGRAADAEQAIEAVINAEPSYHPNDSDLSPRVRSAFTSVRRRILPAIIQARYAESKTAFDRKDFAAAAAGFNQVLTALADQDVASEAKQPPLSDLGVLAAGFEELSAKAAAPPPPAPPPVVVVAKPAAPVVPRIYTADDPNVMPPSVVSQALPMFPGQVMTARTGRIEVVIGESGQVESATMVESVTSKYDSMAVAAAKAWRYAPATVNGTPVKYRKVVQITIKTT
jgi:TonB family protein